MSKKKRKSKSWRDLQREIALREMTDHKAARKAPRIHGAEPRPFPEHMRD